MDHSFGNTAIEEAWYKVFGIFERKGKGVEALMENRAVRQTEREYGMKDVNGVEDNLI